MSRALLSSFLVLLVIMVVLPAEVRSELRLTAPRPGRVFFPGERVSFGLSIDQGTTSVSYLIRDYHGNKVGAGSCILSSPRVTQLRLGTYPQGWYEITFTLGDGSRYVDAFCVLPPMADRGRRYRLFGVCATLDNQERADYLSLAGLRAVRRDWGWPTIEPADDEWAEEFTNGIMTRAQQAGIEFTPVVGYAARHVRVRPADASDGRTALAGHTWAVADLSEWVEFLQWCNNFAKKFPDVYWPPARLAPKAPLRLSMPAVAAWEIWNEADQNFFYGPWDNYCDLLRLAYSVLDRMERPVIYGGSCGHWTETGMAYSWNVRPFFDFAAGHAGHEVDSSMPQWLYGAYSIGYKHGLPYRLAFTEGYFKDDVTGRPFAHYVLPMYGKLYHWGAEQQFRGVDWDESRTVDRATSAICHNLSYGLAPSPAYVALAFARHLLIDAAYVGKLTLPSGVETYVFLRGGVPLAILWNPASPVTISVPVGSTYTALWFDCFGQEHNMGQLDKLKVRLLDEPVVVRGVSWSLVGEAAQARLNEFASTQFGAQPTSGSYWCCYCRTLQTDMASLSPTAWDAAIGAANRAVSQLRDSGRNAHPSLSLAADNFRALIQSLSPATGETRSLTALFNTQWRALALAEWFTEMADAVKEGASGACVSNETLDAVRTEIYRAWNAAVTKSDGCVRPRARALARRAWSSYRLSCASLGPLMSALAQAEARTARAWAKIETPVRTNLLALAQFPTALLLVKAHLLEPGRSHALEPVLANMTPASVNATFNVRFPAGWSPPQVSVACLVPPHTVVRLPAVTFRIPGDPPWVKKSSWRPAGPLEIFAPQQLPPEQQVETWAEADGLRSLSCYYFFNIGSLSMPEQPPPPPPL